MVVPLETLDVAILFCLLYSFLNKSREKSVVNIHIGGFHG